MKVAFVSKRYLFFSLLGIALKLTALFCFSSDFKDMLFFPFVRDFLSDPSGNPWDAYYEAGMLDCFPYPPLMLYILSFASLPCYFFGFDSWLFNNICFKLPLLAADFLISALLIKTFPNRKKEIFLHYFMSPIVIYASYMHSQMDLLPAAVLYASIFFLVRDRIYLSALALGCAVSLKLYVLAAFPLLFFYVYKKKNGLAALAYMIIAAAVHLAFIFPYIGSESYRGMVLSNPKAMTIYSVFYEIGDFKIYLPICACFFLYSRFAIFRHINNDLLYSFIAILFCLFIGLIKPSPAWYVWIQPFFALSLIKIMQSRRLIFSFVFVFGALYLAFFMFFYPSEYSDLNCMGVALDLKFNYPKLTNIMFTALEASLLIVVYMLYKYGIQSNALYQSAGSMVIGIGGDSGAGKSTLLQDLKRLLGGDERLLEIEGDGDHRWERHDRNWGRFTHLDPKANFLHRQAEHIYWLKDGNDVYRSDYGHDTGKFDRPKKVVPKDFIVLCGLHPFYLPNIRKAIDLKIFLHTADDLRIRWKLERDQRVRGYDKDQVLAFIDSREEDSLRYISPQKQFADIVIRYFLKESIGENMSVELIFDSSVEMHQTADVLGKYGVFFDWKYSDDLRNQIFILHSSVPIPLLASLAYENISNLEDLIIKDIHWSEGLRGFVQYVLLLLISYKKQGKR